jgi:hypothetical protein
VEVIHVGDGHVTAAIDVVAAEEAVLVSGSRSRLKMETYSVIRIAVMGPRKMV